MKILGELIKDTLAGKVEIEKALKKLLIGIIETK